MKYGIFSDVHSNTEAFSAVLDALKNEGVEKYLFLGDLVGYGAEPKECIDLLKNLQDETGCVCVGGNHDYAVCDLTDYSHYDRYAREAIEWTKENLDSSSKECLSQMKLVEQVDNLTLVHANLVEPEKWWYILDINDAFPTFRLLETQICFNGHSHKPIVFTSGEMVDWLIDKTIFMEDDKRYIINVGSVGQPRDGDPRAAYAVYDTENKRFEIKRVSYDIQRTQGKVLGAGLPRILADRLSLGK